jgi:hypothetical protein
MISGSPGKIRSSSLPSRIASSPKVQASCLRIRLTVALVEDEIDHRADDREPFRALGRIGRLEWHARLGDAGLRTGDALFHCAVADEKCAGDLLHGQTGDDPQRQCNLLCGRQVRMAADEEQPQDIVAIVGIVQPLGDIAFGVSCVGDQLFVWQCLCL